LGDGVGSAGPPAGRSMEGFTALYFSLITLATVGYGNVVPVAGVVRMLAPMEAIVGMHFVGLLIVQLVSLYPPKAATRSLASFRRIAATRVSLTSAASNAAPASGMTNPVRFRLQTANLHAWTLVQ
jgi:Ion channel